MFVACIKEKVWENISQRYQDDDIQAFLHEATAMDPRFKRRSVSDETWERLRRKAIEANVRPTTGLSDEMTDTEHQEKEESEGEGEKMEETIPPLHIKKSALEELFSEEGRELRLRIQKRHIVPHSQWTCWLRGWTLQKPASHSHGWRTNDVVVVGEESWSVPPHNHCNKLPLCSSLLHP